ncbi:MAG: hypothetical protein JKX87_01725 [Cycloclasticus sp.]|nr:hypothetical protein [Cycloclasticus sp.]
MKIKTILLPLLLTLICSTAYAQTSSEAEQAIQSADKLWAATITAGHEWNTIKPLVAQAKQALKTNDFSAAITLANRASEQSVLALIQAEHEKTNWVNNLPK